MAPLVATSMPSPPPPLSALLALSYVLAAVARASGAEVETFRAEITLGVDAEVQAQQQGLTSSQSPDDDAVQPKATLPTENATEAIIYDPQGLPLPGNSSKVATLVIPSLSQGANVDYNGDVLGNATRDEPQIAADDLRNELYARYAMGPPADVSEHCRSPLCSQLPRMYKAYPGKDTMLYIGRGACGMTLQLLYDGHVALGAESFPTSDGNAPPFPRKCIALLRQDILYRSPVSRLPFPDAAFDLIVVNELLENKDPDAIDFMLDEIRRVAVKDVFVAIKAAHANEPFATTSEEEDEPAVFSASQNLTIDELPSFFRHAPYPITFKDREYWSQRLEACGLQEERQSMATKASKAKPAIRLGGIETFYLQKGAVPVYEGGAAGGGGKGAGTGPLKQRPRHQYAGPIVAQIDTPKILQKVKEARTAALVSPKARVRPAALANGDNRMRSGSGPINRQKPMRVSDARQRDYREAKLTADAETFSIQEQQVLAQQERFRAQHALAAIDRSFQKADHDARTAELLRGLDEELRHLSNRRDKAVLALERRAREVETREQLIRNGDVVGAQLTPEHRKQMQSDVLTLREDMEQQRERLTKLSVAMNMKLAERRDYETHSLRLQRAFDTN